MVATTTRRRIFWVALVGFAAKDFAASSPVYLRLKTPFIAAGSGTITSGGHWAIPR